MAQLINHNGVIQSESEFSISPFNRGLAFGDGFFETCLFDKGNCKLWKWHLERIEKGLKLLSLNLDLKLDQLIDEVQKVIDSNSQRRVKITFYRKGLGAYTPTTNDSAFLVTSKPFEIDRSDNKGLKCDFANEIYVHSNALGIKTLSSLNYIRAAIEKQERKLDDLILLNEKGEIAESTASNVWWVKNEVIYTPGAECGGIEGVFKSYLNHLLKEEGIAYQEGCYTRKDLLDADEVFLTNAVQGISPIGQLDGSFFKSQISHYLIDKASF
jgi:branched-subunit amino acid aminotransferase/4-amino-4-deoxychorismate lyase